MFNGVEMHRTIPGHSTIAGNGDAERVTIVFMGMVVYHGQMRADGERGYSTQWIGEMGS